MSSSSVPNVTSFNSTGASGSLCPAQATSGPQGASSLPVGSHAAWWVAAVACGFSRRREFPQTPAPPAHHTVAARYKPGRPPVLRLPDQVTPALPQPCLLPGSWPPRRPLPLCFLACIGESGFRQPFRGVLCADCRPCPTCSFLEPQTPDRRAAPRSGRSRIRGSGGRRGFSSLEGRTSCVKTARPARVLGLGRRGLQHLCPGKGRGRLTLRPPRDSGQRRPYGCHSHTSLGEVAGPAGPARPPGAGHLSRGKPAHPEAEAPDCGPPDR